MNDFPVTGYIAAAFSFAEWAPWIDAVGYAAAGLTVATYSMRTMIPLRISGICASILFIAYGYLAPSYPQVVLHAVLLPLNIARLRQMLRLVAQVKAASDGDLSMDWIRPFTRKRRCRPGEVVFRKGDAADAMFLVVSGRFHLTEIAVEIGPGQMVGEIGLVAPGNRRTQSFECVEAGELLTIGYEQARQLYFQNPSFGFYFLNLIAKRLLVNAARLEEQLEERKSLAAAKAKA